MREEQQWDVIVAGGNVVFQDRVCAADIGIRDGRISDIAPSLTGKADRVINAKGKVVMTGMIDAHVHLNEPGLGEWEGFANGSSALAAGGCTTYLDMPLNGIPPTIDIGALKMKLDAAARNGSRVDFALWGGLVPHNVGDLEALANAGVIGFKAFMSSPGSTGEGSFREVDDVLLYEGMKTIAGLGKVLAVHAESEEIVSSFTLRKKAAGELSVRDYLESRPAKAELDAVRRALTLAERTECPLHIVHISTPEAVDLIQEAKQSGLDVTVETCPHYLFFTDEDVERIGAEAKCAPPIRSEREREELWERIASRAIDMVASDHSPCPSSMKKGADGDFFSVWGGISGAQSSMELVFDEGYLKRGIELPLLSRLLSETPARRFGLYPGKGRIAVGAYADLAIIDPDTPYILQETQLHYRHPHSAYAGHKFGCQVALTLCRGTVVYDRETGFGGEASGIWLRPEKSNAGIS